MQKIYVHPLPVRIWHWTNAFGFILLIVTGLQIRYVGLINLMQFKTAVVAHNWIGFVLIANFFVWLTFYLSTDKIKVYHPELNPKKYFRDSFRQLQFYGYGVFRGDPNPHHVSMYHKFNPMQSMAYQIIMMLLVPLQIFTGLLLWNVTQFSSLVDMFGGVRVVDTAHVVLFIIFTGFIMVHPYLASLGHTPTAHFKAMITGYEEVEDEAEHGASS
ncbi:Cytochrome B561 [Georgfuchsia toluolica]|uniref:Cytochrome B561 n=1 Tax=Georgfuchsia toluolica TaxID=424218 RepID=A0A916J631_9PROT|nr:cytochrome b/b6 domain-containing protein [Georgfuchsia toluolica]CAG4884926.1 Cytochrome B561 [Georgfuchsia toluolica]